MGISGPANTDPSDFDSNHNLEEKRAGKRGDQNELWYLVRGSWY